MDANKYTTTNKQEAQKIVNKFNARTYYLSHGEYERPCYKVRKVRGQSLYYIYAKRYFFPGTFYAAESGPLEWEDVLY